MAACIIDNINPVNVEKIESFLNDSSYKEALESSASFNTRLSIERRMRLPFLDSQTGVAQNHSQLFMSKRQRMPGMVPGQIYSYPRPRWRKKRRQYLLNTRPFGRFEAMDDSDLHSISQMENPGIMQDNDSKDSQMLKDEVAAKEWYYDEAELLEMDPYDDQDQDSDLDYEESRKAKKRRGTGRGRGSGSVDSPGTPGRKKGGGRGRKRASMHNYEPTPGDPDKPFSCERTPGKRGRPASAATVAAAAAAAAAGAAAAPSQQAPPTLPPNLPVATPPQSDDPQMPVLVPEKIDAPPSTSSIGPPPLPQPSQILPFGEKPKAAPSPYCDFCLGDAAENKKTAEPEELVSCSDCGRSGHPSCLQFTANMNISVKKYRWQCIECKCCSVCGTSDNDDQLLFCDDCDRGYHMYCLSPPLNAPPEGSWSCKLCIEEFHKQ